MIVFDTFGTKYLLGTKYLSEMSGDKRYRSVRRSQLKNMVSRWPNRMRLDAHYQTWTQYRGWSGSLRNGIDSKILTIGCKEFRGIHTEDIVRWAKKAK